MRSVHLSLAALVLAGAAYPASAVVHRFDVFLNGFNEVTSAGVPNQGDPDGFGIAVLMIDDGFTPPQISWNFTVQNITLPLSGAHIHVGAANTTGPVRVDFDAQLSGTGLPDADLTAVLADPTNWYVNLHNADFPAGAIRGQIPAPSSIALLALAAPVALRRRR